MKVNVETIDNRNIGQVFRSLDGTHHAMITSIRLDPVSQLVHLGLGPEVHEYDYGTQAEIFYSPELRFARAREEEEYSSGGVLHDGDLKEIQRAVMASLTEALSQGVAA